MGPRKSQRCWLSVKGRRLQHCWPPERRWAASGRGGDEEVDFLRASMQNQACTPWFDLREARLRLPTSECRQMNVRLVIVSMAAGNELISYWVLFLLSVCTCMQVYMYVSVYRCGGHQTALGLVPWALSHTQTHTCM